MIDVKIGISQEEIKRRLGALQSRSGHVIARAANRAIDTGKTVIKKQTAKIYNVRQKDVENVLKVERATSKHPYARMIFKDKHQNLAVFGKSSSLSPRTPVRSSDPTNPDPAYYRAKVMNGHGTVPLKGRPKPFVQFAGKDRNAILLQRKSNASRAPLRGVAAPALPQILKNDDIIEKFNHEASVMFAKRLEHEIDQVLKGDVK